MRSRLLILILLLIVIRSSFGAAGDIVAVHILPGGTNAAVVISALNTNGTYAFGLGTNNSITGNEKVVFTVTSPTFSDSGIAGTFPRTVYGVQQCRKPYPNQAAIQEILSNEGAFASGNVTNVVSLSHSIYSGDSATVTIASAFYTAGGTPNNSTTALSVNNLSALNYPKVSGHFVLENRRSLNGSVTMEVVAAQIQGAQQFRPVRLVKVVATGGTSGHVESGSATTMARSTRDGWPVYAVTLSLSTGAGFTRGELVTINATNFPWLGDTTAILDFQADASKLYETQPLKWTIMDKLIAVVDRATTDDTTGWAAVLQANADAHPFKTIGAAITAVAGTNNTLYSLNRADGGEIQCKASGWDTGKYNATTVQNGYFTITRHASATRANVIFTNFITSQFQYAYQRYYDVTFQRAANGFLVFAANPNVFVLEGVNFFDGFTGWYSGDTGTDIEFLDCVSTNSRFSPGGTDGHCRLIRNCTYTNLANTSQLWGNASCIYGNYVNGYGANNYWTAILNASQTNVIIGYNRVLAMSDNYFITGSGTAALKDFTVINNLVERIGSSTAPISEISDANHENVCGANNSYVGQRFNHENDITAAFVNKTFHNWSWRNNIFASRGDHRADIRDTDGTMIGTWGVGYSVDWLGNWNEAAPYLGDTDFWGLNSKTPTYPATGFTTGTNSAGYVTDASTTGTGAGNGVYRLRSGAVAALLTQTDAILPFDLDGNYRGLLDPPGAYASASPRKGSGFFAQ